MLASNKDLLWKSLPTLKEILWSKAGKDMIRQTRNGLWSKWKMVIQFDQSLLALALNSSAHSGQTKISKLNLLIPMTTTFGSFFHLVPDLIENQYYYSIAYLYCSPVIVGRNNIFRLPLQYVSLTVIFHQSFIFDFIVKKYCIALIIFIVSIVCQFIWS